jgi:hypothetical protein
MSRCDSKASIRLRSTARVASRGCEPGIIRRGAGSTPARRFAVLAAAGSCGLSPCLRGSRAGSKIQGEFYPHCGGKSKSRRGARAELPDSCGGRAISTGPRRPCEGTGPSGGSDTAGQAPGRKDPTSSMKVKSPESLPLRRTVAPTFPSASSLSTSARESRNLRRSVAPAAQVPAPHSGPRPGQHRHGRPPAAVRPVRRWTVRRLPGRALGSTPAAHVAAPYDRVLEQSGCQTGAVVVQQVHELGWYGTHVHPLQDSELGGVPARGAQREGPGAEELVVRGDAEFAVRPEAPGGAPVATAENDRRTGGHDHPVFGHRDTPVPVRRPQRKGARRTCATRDGSALGGSHLVYNGTSLTGWLWVGAR